jgi:hypothetical protein
MKTPEPKSDSGFKNTQNASSASSIATPRSGIQNDKDYLIQELAPEMMPGVRFPVIKRTSSSYDRLVRKWRLKVRYSSTLETTDEEVAKMPAVKLVPRSDAKAPHETPAACMRAPSPPMIPRRKTVVPPVPPPNLKAISLSSSLGGEIDLSRKPRPTVLFLSPRKRRRRVENGSRKSPAA